MKFLKRDTSVSDNPVTDDLIRNYKRKDKRVPSLSSDDIAIAQEAITTLSNQFRSNAEEQQLAAKRMGGLTKTITKMETRLREFDRVEVDNHRLAKELSDTTQQLKQKVLLSEEQDKNVLDLRRQRNEFRAELETVKKDLAEYKYRDTSSRDVLLKQSNEIDGLKTDISQKEDKIQSLNITQKNLKDDLIQASTDLADERHRSVELQKSTEELSARLSSKTQTADKILTELKSVQGRFSEQKEKLFTLKSETQSLTYNLESQKASYEDTLKRRNEELTILKTQVEHMSTQIRIKENMTSHFDDELSGLRAALDAERSRATRASNALHNKTEELERNNKALTHSKAEFEALQAKFTQTAEDMETLRKICAIQKQKLERYASISGGATGDVFVHQDKSTTEYDYSPQLKAV